MHTCGKCGFCKPDGAFYLYANGKPHPPCKDCRRSYRPPHEAVSEKRCSKCGEVKGVADFGPTANTKSGLRPACRDCERRRRPERILTPGEKRCPTCFVTKPESDFYRTDRTKDGLYARCKGCHNERAAPGQKAYRAANAERARDWGRKSAATFYSTPGRMEEQLERLREYNRLHPESKAIREQRRKARKRNTVNDFTLEQWQALKVAYGQRCAYCGKHTKRLTMDHVIPVSKGGEHTARNIVPACRPCNSSKGTKPAPDHQTSVPIESLM